MNQCIFVSVASYQDTMLLFTLRSAFANAHQPELLRFAVVDQHSCDQREVIRSLSFWRQIRYCHTHPEDTLGVSWARNIAFSLYDGEKYLIQIDSHTCFEPGWDNNLRRQHEQLLSHSAKPILTTYPYSFEMVNGEPVHNRFTRKTVLVLRPHPETPLTPHSVVLRFQAKHLFTDRPVNGCHVAAGFLFCDGSFVEEVPYDPYMYFEGEEQSLAARCYTRGWDIYHPPRIPLYHLYKRTNVAHDTYHWHAEVNAQRAFDYVKLRRRAAQRLERLLCGDGLPGSYGLGNIRSMDQFAILSGIDYKGRVIVDTLEEKLS